MSPLLAFREKLNLTQEELATKSGISVRTIQRIESGTKPKGYTLDALSTALGINKNDLLKEKEASAKINTALIKYINLSSILLLIVPFGCILMPLFIMRWKNEFNTITKQIISIQIAWTIAFPVIMFLVNIIGSWFSIDNEIVPIAVLILLVTNIYIILRNTIELEKNNKLHFDLKFNFI